MIKTVPDSIHVYEAGGGLQAGDKAHITIKSNPGTLYIGQTREELEIPVVGVQGGIPLTSTSGTVEVAWSGPIYYKSDTAGLVFLLSYAKG